MKKCIVFIVDLIMLMSVPYAALAENAQFTLEQTVLAGLKANPGVEATKKILEQSQLNVDVARGYFLPSLSIKSSLLRYRSRGDVVQIDDVERNAVSKELHIQQPLFEASSIINYTESKLQVEIDHAKFEQARLDLIYHIQKSFLQLLKAREDLKTIDDEILRLQTQLDASKAFHKAEIYPYNDVLKNKVELVKAQSDKIKIQNNIKNYSTQLNTFIAAQYNEPIQYAGNLFSYNFSLAYDEASAIKAAIEKRPDIVIAKKSIELAKKDTQKKVSEYLPRITLDYSRTNKQTNYKNYIYRGVDQVADSISLNMTWEIFGGGKTTYGYSGELKHVTAMEKNLEEKSADVKEKILKAFTDIDDAQKLIELGIQVKKSARENYNMASKQYKTGIGSITDLLDAQSELTQSEASLSDAYMQYHTARATLFYNIGVENYGLN